MEQDRKTGLEDRLKSYSSVAGCAATRATLKQRMGNWPVYAAVTGSAVAMATNASAGVIYSGIQNLTASISSVGVVPGPSTVNHASGQVVNLTANGAGFQILVAQNLTTQGGLGGIAAVQGFGSLEFLDQGTFSLRKLHFGANVSTQNGVGSQAGFLKEVEKTGSHTSSRGIWRPGQRRFAAFAFYTNTTANAQVDFGWLRLVFSDSAINGLPDSITAVDWAYEDSGAPIVTGEGISGAPEPSTSALALLATGAFGVAALRRRRKATV